MLEPKIIEENNYRLHRRFDRIGRLVGDGGMAKLFASRILVVGLGGVGSWAAESLVRSGIGSVGIVDFDDICITNINRQIHAQQNLVGQKKAQVMGERLKRINPQADIRVFEKFYNAENSDEILNFKPDIVLDAIDNLTAKCHLLNRCRAEGVPVITSGGSGGRLDPGRIVVRDLMETHTDPMLHQVRKILRSKYEFPAEGPFGIPTVFSEEDYTAPYELTYDKGKGFQCVCPQGANNFHSCEKRNLIYGTASFVTGSIGLRMASLAVQSVLKQDLDRSTV